MASTGYARLSWLLKRLFAMSAAEVRHRVGEQIKRAVDRRRSYGWAHFPRSASQPVFPRLGQALRDFGDQGLADALRSSSDALLAGKFKALGVDWPARSASDLFPAELWRLDPVTGNLWPGPGQFATDIDYRNQTARGSIKYPWEINRLQFLQPLAAAFFVDGDRRCLAAIETAISSWYEANPPFRGVNWASGIELSLRAVSLVAVSSLCGEALSPVVRDQIGSILAASFYWLQRYPSRFSSANNHLIAEELGIFLIGALQPDLPGAASAVARARVVLECEAQALILADGVGAEQSPTYAALTAECLLTAALLARAVGKPLNAAVDRRLERFAGCIAWLALPTGETPAIGDDDEGRVWNTLGPRETAYPASVAASVCGYLGRPAMGAVSPQVELRDAVFSAPRLSAPPPRGLMSFREGGYTVVRDARAGRRLDLVMDHGPLGYLSIAAHGHSDANAMTLAVDGVPILIDPGTFIYHALDDWRSWFRGVRAHNTLSIRNEDQSRIAGPFMWSHKANAQLDHVTDGADWSITASHDGYRRRFGVDHRRTVCACEDGLMVVDTLTPGPCAEPVELVFQFAPTVSVRRQGAGVLVSNRGRAVLLLEFEQPGEIALETGGEAYDQGWVSLQFGRKTPAPRLSWRGILPAGGQTTRLRLVGEPDRAVRQEHPADVEIVPPAH